MDSRSNPYVKQSLLRIEIQLGGNFPFDTLSVRTSYSKSRNSRDYYIIERAQEIKHPNRVTASPLHRRPVDWNGPDRFTAIKLWIFRIHFSRSPAWHSLLIIAPLPSPFKGILMVFSPDFPQLCAHLCCGWAASVLGCARSRGLRRRLWGSEHKSLLTLTCIGVGSDDFGTR